MQLLRRKSFVRALAHQQISQPFHSAVSGGTSFLCKQPSVTGTASAAGHHQSSLLGRGGDGEMLSVHSRSKVTVTSARRGQQRVFEARA